MTTPNIFNFATSELSQDAALAYILEWAAPQYRADYPELNKLGEDLLRALLAKVKHDSIEKIEKVCVYTQEDRIDVQVRINDSVFLIIEDKTNTGKHSNQIARYKELAASLKNCKGHSWQHILAVYLNTGNESPCSFPETADGYFLRVDLLDVLNNNPDTGNDIIEEFTRHLDNLEKDTQSFMTVPFADWSWNAHHGYYLALQKYLGEGDWGYAANPAGGSLVFYWLDKKITAHRCHIYLQIDHQKGLFIRACDATDSNAQWTKVSVDTLRGLLDKARQHADGLDGIQVKKPSRFRSGATANAAEIYFDGDEENSGDGGSYLATKQDKTIDLKATIDRLKKAMELVDAMCGRVNT